LINPTQTYPPHKPQT